MKLRFDSLGIDYLEGRRSPLIGDGHENPEDRRMRETVVSAKGKAVTDKLDQVRERLARGIFQDWAAEDVADFVRLMRKFAEALELGTRAWGG
ncbi:hypothetical protein [Achromobacter piechaudii]|uniref:hypothetical protein n=1 Tax=Achromobacter piechaudii TaxID=72556 RepID=UPI0012E2A48A|nr:hypothetical protein [Achromobacter piechaudii]